MPLSPEQRRELRHWLGTIDDQELDCDRFAELLAEFVDGTVECETVRKLMQVHADMCPECEESRSILVKAIGS